MKLHAIVFEKRDDPTLRLHSAWDEEQVASDPELVQEQVADAFKLQGTERAGAMVIDVDDVAVRACLARSLPDEPSEAGPAVQATVEG